MIPVSLSRLTPCCLALVLVLAPLGTAQDDVGPFDPTRASVTELDDGRILAVGNDGAQLYGSWAEYFGSRFFDDNVMKCGVRMLPAMGGDGSTADCNGNFTNPAAEYDPGTGKYRVPVVVHILMHPNGNGAISDAQVQSQIDVLNEDFLALPGSNGGQGNDTQVEFYLATTDPDGNATTGITRHTNKKWYSDQGNYANATGWDTNRYLNIYTNTAGGNLGYAYVPSTGGVVGASFDGVRIHWLAFGDDAPIGSPYDLGRTATHEVGHYFGLYHTFDGGCASQAGCASNGDLICDTNPEQVPMTSGSCSRSTCSSPDPTNNYLDYSDDICMTEFTSNQASRMRCTVDNFRSVLVTWDTGNTAPSVSIDSPNNGHTVNDGDPITFQGSASDAEDGNISSGISWSSNQDGPLGSGASVNATLTVGTHTITAQVEDSGGLSASDAISVTVQGQGGGISLSGNSYKVKGRVHVDLTWSGANGSSVDVWRNGSIVATTANDGFYTDNTGFKGGGSITYQVCEAGTGTCSATINVTY